MENLTAEEITHAQSLIDEKQAGTYELKAIYGSAEWAKIVSPTSFGAKFKSAVNAHALANIKLLAPPNDKRSDNHHMYEIRRPL